MDKIAVSGVLLILIFGFTAAGYAQDMQYQLSRSLMSFQLSQRDYLMEIADEDGEAQEDAKPNLNAIRIGGEILAGEVTGIVIALAPVSIMDRIFPDKEFGWLAIANLAVTYPIGNALGVYLVGNIGDETGSFLAALAGSYIGALAGTFLFMKVMGSEGDVHWIHIIKPFIVTPVAAAIAFNLTRKYKSSENSNGQTNSAPPAFRLNLMRMSF